MIDRTLPSSSVVEKLINKPVSKDLAENADIDLFVSLGVPPARRADTAQELLAGDLNAPTFLPKPYHLQGWPNDLTVGGPTFQLVMASLAVEDLLLKEFEANKSRSYYLLARDRILAFAQWELQQREPFSFLWNDHAIAARISVLIRLWRTLRDDSETSPSQRTELIALVARSGELLAKKSQFTVRTNHGVMQNMALLQISAAFPDLPKAHQWRNLAIQRLAIQLEFYVSDEGVVLEHSAGYHLFGSHLLASGLKLARLNKFDPPQWWVKSYLETTNFSRWLTRPDGSLPLVGNTAGGTQSMPVAASIGDTPIGSSIYPLSGYGIWWESDPVSSQTVVAWAKHDRHGHKHADEPSVHFWSRGIDWITATGYWPYGARGYDQANGWLGSNAPHAKNEDAKSKRTVQLLGSGQSGNIRAIDIQNTRQSGLTVRRQIVQISAEKILVLDFVRGALLPVETLWTLDSRLTLQAVSDQKFRSSANDGGYALHIDIANSEGSVTPHALYRGSWTPFAGWVVMGREPKPAPSLFVEQKTGDSFTATLFSVSKQQDSGLLKIVEGGGFEKWTIELPGLSKLQRVGNLIKISDHRDSTVVELAAPPLLATRQLALRTAMSQAIDAYSPWRSLRIYQQRVYIAIALLWVAIEITIGILVWRRQRRKWMEPIIIVCWCSVAWWVHFYYLV